MNGKYLCPAQRPIILTAEAEEPPALLLGPDLRLIHFTRRADSHVTAVLYRIMEREGIDGAAALAASCAADAGGDLRCAF